MWVLCLVWLQYFLLHKLCFLLWYTVKNFPEYHRPFDCVDRSTRPCPKMTDVKESLKSQVHPARKPRLSPSWQRLRCSVHCSGEILMGNTRQGYEVVPDYCILYKYVFLERSHPGIHLLKNFVQFTTSTSVTAGLFLQILGGGGCQIYLFVCFCFSYSLQCLIQLSKMWIIWAFAYLVIFTS